MQTFSLPIIALLLAGCTSIGNDSLAEATSATVSEQVVKGRTAQVDVRRLYGDLLSTSFNVNGEETWNYEFTRTQPKATNFIPVVNLIKSGTNMDRKSLVVVFDRQKVVQDFTMSASKFDSNTGLITH